MAASGRPSPPWKSTPGSFSTVHTQRVASMISGARMLPSLSTSSSCSVRESNSRPEVGQASTDHSFWSSSPRWRRSSAVSMRTWSKPPERKNRHW
jgi:hypothetical protein